MSLTVSYISGLHEVVGPAVDFLSRDRDLFARPRIVVPNAGTRAWLTAMLAARLGARGTDDGVVTGVEVCYPRALAGLLESGPGRGESAEDDPWAIDRLTFTVLSVIAGRDEYADLCTRCGGPLLAARAMAERFDDYHVRRPDMIRLWAQGQAKVSPTAEHPNPDDLPAAAMTQYRIWRAVHEAIGSALPPPPCRDVKPAAAACDVLVAGLQHLSVQQIRWLEQIGKAADVEVYLAHPSPALHGRWAPSAPPITAGLVPERTDPPRDRDVDSLVAAWLRGARETQWLLASQGMPTVPPPAAEHPADGSLLARLARTVTHDLTATPVAFDVADVSVRIHRCHGLARQAEVLHDAILHAFREIPDLRPHEVAIVSPCIAEAAAHLEAVFARTVEGEGGEMHLPLVVADRGIRELSPGAELLTSLLALVRSRYSLDGVLSVAAHPLVLARFGIDDDGIAVWDRCLDRTKIRWGLDDGQRKTAGLDAPGLRAHTWRLGLEQMLLGATLPDAAPREELGGVVPLDDVEPAHIDAIAALVTIVGVIATLEAEAADGRAVGGWCDLLEDALVRLCGEESAALVEPLRALETLRRSANDVAVPFHDVKSLLVDALDAPSGRQPLRTGAVTATSMVPLRGVPFRVIGVIGYDDRAVSPGESRSDDLVAAQELLGDIDPRLEVRRGLLDCLLACENRLIVTCTGMDVATNKTLPLVTPLAELVDLARRQGVPDVERDGERFSAIETFHPRHAVSPRNFVAGELHPGVPWSHDGRSRQTAGRLRQPTVDETVSAGVATPMTTVELSRIEKMLHDPLAAFVRTTLDIDTWRDGDEAVPATLPLGLSKRERRRLAEGLLQVVAAGPDQEAVTNWGDAMQAVGQLPFGTFGTALRDELAAVVRGIVAEATARGMPLDGGGNRDVRLAVGRFQIVGMLERVYLGNRPGDIGRILCVYPEPLGSTEFHRPRISAGLFLLVAIAEGLDVREACVVGQHPKWKPDGSAAVTTVRSIRAAVGIDADEARRRLERLCELLELATAVPCGTFGDAAARTIEDPASDAGRTEFYKFVNDPFRYPKSLERIAYGARPDYARVFFVGSPESTYHERFAGLLAFHKVTDTECELR